MSSRQFVSSCFKTPSVMGYHALTTYSISKLTHISFLLGDGYYVIYERYLPEIPEIYFKFTIDLCSMRRYISRSKQFSRICRRSISNFKNILNEHLQYFSCLSPTFRLNRDVFLAYQYCKICYGDIGVTALFCKEKTCRREKLWVQHVTHHHHHHHNTPHQNC